VWCRPCHKHFKEQELDKTRLPLRIRFSHWEAHAIYGYLSFKEDLNIFTKHNGEKLTLKFKTRSYQDV